MSEIIQPSEGSALLRAGSRIFIGVAKGYRFPSSYSLGHLGRGEGWAAGEHPDSGDTEILSGVPSQSVTGHREHFSDGVPTCGHSFGSTRPKAQSTFIDNRRAHEQRA